VDPRAPARIRRFVTPAVVVLVLVTVLPLLYLVVTSFTPLDLTNPSSRRWAGLTNYRQLAADGRFWNSVWVQGAALVLDRVAPDGHRLRHRAPAERAPALPRVGTRCLHRPMVLPPVVVALIWKILFTPDISILDWSLGCSACPSRPG